MLSKAILAFTLLSILISANPVEPAQSFSWPTTLSAWQLFESPLASLSPTPDVIAYDVNAPLYSDYAQKSRFIKLPKGSSATFHPTEAFEMPDGTVLIKNFFYYNDERQPALGKHILETRLIVRDQGEWYAMTYRWNAGQTEAYKAVAGGSEEISWIDSKDATRKLQYLIPDVNQCKNCHQQNNTLLPIGITARQLNDNDAQNQLHHWQQRGILTGVPNDLSSIPRLADYHDNNNVLDNRARAYLDANCGHCHSPEGSARTSGLNLTSEETNLHALGVMKPPVAAGRGSGGLQYSIVPGKPNKSILVFRMESSDPGIRMPEINRQIPHVEGIELIKEWVKEMENE